MGRRRATVDDVPLLYAATKNRSANIYWFHSGGGLQIAIVSCDHLWGSFKARLAYLQRLDRHETKHKFLFCHRRIASM